MSATLSNQAGRNQAWLWLVAAAGLFLALPGASAHAQGKRVAVVIGNAKYSNEAPLANPANDARLIARTLKNDLAFDEVIERQDLTRSQLYDVVSEIGRRARGADAVVVYYSGHGMRGPGGNYLIPVDARISEEEHVRRDAVPAAEIADALQASNARVALLVLDACRDSPYSRRTRSASKGLTRMNVSGGNLLVAYATSEGNTADDGSGGNSPYAKALADALKQAKPVLAQLDDVRRNVRQSTGGKQNPTREGDLEVNIYLVNPTITVNNNAGASGAPGATTVRSDPDEEAWKAAQGADTVEGYEQYLSDFGTGRNVSAAKIRLSAAKRREAATAVSSRPAPPLASASTASQSAPSAQPGQVFRDCQQAHCPEMVLIPAGRFTMGSNDYESERPPHQVNIRSFAMGKYEVTQGQWKAVMGENPSRFKECGDSCPVEKVSWDDIQQYLQKLNQMTGQQYRLPSEAEWEYAARAGSSTKYSWGDEIGKNNANCDGCGSRWDDKSTAPVGSFAANAYGLHDMQGNVWEWVQDVGHDNYQGAPTDGSAWLSGGDQRRRVLRGGSWNSYPLILRAASRYWGTPDDRISNLGFRVARTVNP